MLLVKAKVRLGQAFCVEAFMVGDLLECLQIEAIDGHFKMVVVGIDGEKELSLAEGAIGVVEDAN